MLLEPKVFNSLKSLLAQVPILSFPDFRLQFYIASDASIVRIGVILYQLPDDEDNSKTIKYIDIAACSLQEHKRICCVTKKELLTIVFVLKKFHYYLWQNHITMYTDHRALQHIHLQKDLNPMLIGWFNVIMSYTFKVIYCPGAQNVLPDAMSRQFPQELWNDHAPSKGPLKCYGFTCTVVEQETSSLGQLGDQMQEVTGYVHSLKGDENAYDEVPKTEHNILLAEAHELNHSKTNIMVNYIYSLYKTWPHLARECLEYVKQCRDYQKFNM